MKKYLILFLFLLFATVSSAQNNYQDVVYLKNGSIIRGVIIEQVPNKSIKIETADRSVFVHTMDEIEKLTKEPFQKNNEYRSSSGLQSGYKVIVELGNQVASGSFGMDRLKLNIVNGYQINPYFSLGFGTGLRYYFDAEAALIPFFADFRTYFINNKVTPYLSLGIGYSLDATNSLEGVGFLLNPATGVSFKVGNSAMNVGLGYEMQKMDFYYTGYNYGSYNYYTSSENSGAISINVGISF